MAAASWGRRKVEHAANGRRRPRIVFVGQRRGMTSHEPRECTVHITRMMYVRIMTPIGVHICHDRSGQSIECGSPAAARPRPYHGWPAPLYPLHTYIVRILYAWPSTQLVWVKIAASGGGSRLIIELFVPCGQYVQ